MTCKFCGKNGEHYCREKGRTLDPDDDSGSFLLSAVIGAATDSALIGGLIGGDLVGGIVGDMLDGDLFD